MKLCTIASGVAAGIASSALAGPLFTVVASVSGFATQTNLSNGLSTEEVGRYSYVGGLTAGPSRSWFIDWDVLGDDTTAVPGATFVTNGFTITNAGTTSRTFDITVSLATPLTNPGQLSCFGNLSGTLTSDNGSLATVTALSPALWQGQVNGVTKLTLNPTVPNTTTTTVFGPVSGTWTGAVPGGPNVQTVGYQMKFTLSANSTVQFSGLWSGTAAVPAPGACTLILAAAGLGSTRRRRNMT